MKKLFIFLAIVLIIVVIVGFKYVSYKTEYNIIQKENSEYEQYKDKELNGLDVATMQEVSGSYLDVTGSAIRQEYATVLYNYLVIFVYFSHKGISVINH